MQTRLTNWLTNRLSKQLNTTVSIDRVDFRFFNKLVLDGVYIADKDNDTLCHINQIKLGILFFNNKQKEVQLSSVAIDQLYLNLYKTEDSISNYRFLIEAFKPKEKRDNEWQVDANEIQLKQSRIRYWRHDKQLKEFGMNYADLEFNSIDASISNFQYFADTIISEINKLSLFEKSGLKLSSFTSEIEFTSQVAKFKQFNATTNNSTLASSYCNFYYDNVQATSYFIDSVSFDAEMLKSNISFKDVELFSPSLQGMDENISISGVITGTVPHMSCSDINLQFGSISSFKGDLDMIGLPEVDDMFMHADIDALISNKADLESLKLPYISSIRYMKLPEEIAKFGTIHYKGMFTGFISDMVSFGTINSELGTIETDLGLTKVKESEMDFHGLIETQNFDLGHLLSLDTIIGKIDMNLKLSGSQKPNLLTADIDGKINSLEANKYEYKDVSIRGNMLNKRFDGFIEIIDPNLDLEFSGMFDFSQAAPKFKFSAIVEKARLDMLNLYHLDTLPELSFTMKTNFIGSDIDNFKGEIYLWDTEYKSLDCEAIISELSMNSFTIDSIDYMILESSAADASFEGKFTFGSMYNNFLAYAKFFLPSLPLNANKSSDNDNFDFTIELKKTEDITNTFIPFLRFEEGTTFTGHFNSNDNSLWSEATIPSFTYGNNTFSNISLQALSQNDTLNLNATSTKVISSASLEIEQLNISTSTHNDSSFVAINWQNSDTIDYSGQLSNLFTFHLTDSDEFITFIDIFPGNVTIADSTWEVLDSKISIGEKLLEIESFNFQKGNQYINMDGAVSESPEDTLDVHFSKIPISNFNDLFASMGFSLNGIINGSASLSSLYSNPVFYSDLKIDSLKMNQQLLGDASFKSSWNNDLKHIDINAMIARGQVKPMRTTGYYIPKSGVIDLNISLDRFYLHTLEPFATGLVSDVKGLASNDLHLNGTIKEPVLSGVIKLQKASFVVDYLNTRYNLSNDVTFEKNRIAFNNIQLFDMKGHEASASGSVTHNYFKDFELDVDIDAQNFQFLNTEESQNELYYGTAYATGTVNITGPINKILIDIKAKTEQGTKFFIPLYSESEVTSSDFITFVTKTEVIKEVVYDEAPDMSGIELLLKLNVTPEAEVQLIFDSKVGDLVKGQGSANLNMEINTLGVFNMYGDYTISKGEYLFTLGNLLSKKFKVKPGGTISWNGDPYDADLNLNTYYGVNTSLQDLLLDTTNYRQRIPVECKIAMTGKLLSPDYGFSIELPKSAESERALLQNLPENELNKQFISLLFINKFQPLAGLDNTGIAPTGSYNIYESSSEILSNQLSHWLSQISNDFDIGFTYRPGDDVTSDEVEVALKTQLFNDRLSINGNVGMGGQYANSNSVVGDVEADLKLNESGKVRVKAYSKANTNLDYEKGPYTRGFGVFYREEFNSIEELLLKYFPYLDRIKK